MKTPISGGYWFFVDESGDPTFYNKKGQCIVGQEGCSPLLILGFVETQDPRPIRQALAALQQEIVNDAYFQGFPSLPKTAIAFHAKDDRPEVRYRVFKLIASLDFRAQFVVARKVEPIFRHQFQASEQAFYDYLVSCLFEQVMHRYQHNHIIFAKRGSRMRQAPLVNAIQAGIRRFETKRNKSVNTTFTVEAHRPGGEPCLSIIDYLNWAIYRAFTRGEMSYCRTVADRISYLVDIYDDGKRPGNRYSRKNPFDIEKVTPLQLGPP